MDRKLKINYSGFSLIELIVTMIIFVILLSISYLWYHEWIKKVTVEQDTRAIFSLLNTAKNKAFAEKVLCGIIWTGNNNNIRSMELRCDSNLNNSLLDDQAKNVLSLKFPFVSSTAASYLLFSRSGLSMTLGTIHASIQTEASYDCVKISRTSVRMGKWDAENSKCKLK